jgi:hypothetical protein
VRNQVTFHLQKSGCDLKFSCKSYGQISKKGKKNV